ncbi:hypothetical protein HBI25_057080 [Parastagonospora nodorum]|nr:hypothetical protein HBH51_039840 [Parastagonospora nodorum]KAH3994798.1 hypothetical protein HBI10_179750 [Parastagonospora nodorum]KAH4014953.1 hypothetical protein HBI13_164880 [Parastagonospora nodorum]KAH4024404.1 hypothetical protein HBI09_160310 [Parastagonospora nodorum]KAH4925295.1 hypothetical protein HBI79_153380 [Parastagonospora nodorum]
MPANSQEKTKRRTGQNVMPKIPKPARPKTKTKAVHAARRVLAQRKVGEKQEYLVDWYPTWQPKHHVPNGKMLREWENNMAKGHTFKMSANLTVYKCSNPTEDNSARQMRLMLDTALNSLQQWLDRPKKLMSTDLFKRGAWTFSTIEDSQLAAKQAARKGDDPPSAAKVMRDTYISMRGPSHESIEDKNLIYKDVYVRYLGQVDKDTPGAKPANRGSGRTVAYIQHMFEPMLREMVPETWKGNEQLHTQLSQLYEIATRFVTKSAFLLNHVWPLFFVRLFFTSDQLVKAFNNPNNPMWTFKISDGWENRTRDYFLQTYIAANDWEQRPVDCVERTYLELRDLVKWHVKFRNVDDEGLGQEQEPAESSDSEDEGLADLRHDDASDADYQEGQVDVDGEGSVVGASEDDSQGEDMDLED